MFNLLTEPLIRVATEDRDTTARSLPALLAALGEDRIAAFPGLRPHQRHALHAFLVQLTVLALEPGTDSSNWPTDEAGWRVALRALTPGFPDDEPWSLAVEDLTKPAFLQPPVPEGTLAGFKNVFRTPDAIDILITAKSHDVKAEIITDPQADEWLFALLSLQTQEGYSGATQYGVSRMNGGFASRPGLGVVPPGGPGARWRRDVRLLCQALAKHDQAPRDEWAGYDDRAGLGLVWLEPWHGATSLDRGRLHPLYVEICRRVRLVSEGGRLIAYQTGTKARRIVEAVGGATGDPWTPIATKDKKALTVPARGFHYRLMSDLLVGTEWSLPLLSRALPGEPGPLSLVARALTRGQGKTEGLHERTIPLPAAVVSVIFGGKEIRKDVGQLARDRIDAIGELQAALDFAARVLVQGGPQEVSPNAARNAFTGGLRLRLDAYADATFFEDLWAEIEAGSSSEAWRAIRRDWMAQLYRFAHRLLVEAGESLPVPSARRARARVEAEGAFRSGLAKKKQWKDFLPAYWAQRRPPGEELEPDAREDAA